MVGRMAMNNTWEIAGIDKEFFPELVDKDTKPPTREEIMKKYAEFAQSEQDREMKENKKVLSNTILLRPIINLFVGEFKGADFRKKISVMAT